MRRILLIIALCNTAKANVEVQPGFLISIPYPSGNVINTKSSSGVVLDGLYMLNDNYGFLFGLRHEFEKKIRIQDESEYFSSVSPHIDFVQISSSKIGFFIGASYIIPFKDSSSSLEAGDEVSGVLGLLYRFDDSVQIDIMYQLSKFEINNVEAELSETIFVLKYLFN